MQNNKVQMRTSVRLAWRSSIAASAFAPSSSIALLSTVVSIIIIKLHKSRFSSLVLRASPFANCAAPISVILLSERLMYYTEMNDVVSTSKTVLSASAAPIAVTPQSHSSQLLSHKLILIFST
jgi:hypothetical protein